MTQHQRQFTRHKVVLKVAVRTRQGWIPCTTVDVSRGGLFVKSEARFDLQRVVQMRLHLPDGVPVSVLGQVRRNVMHVPGASPVPGIGVEFFNMNPTDQTRWDLFVMSLSEDDKQAMADALAPPSTDPQLSPPPAAAGRARHGATTGNATAPHGAAAQQATVTARGGHVAAGPRIGRRPAGRPTRPTITHVVSADLPAVVIRVRPSTGGRLQRLIEQRLWGDALTLRTNERLTEQQRVELVLVHHKTDAEFVVQAGCATASPRDRQGQQIVSLSFPPLSDDLKGGLTRFLRTGTRDMQHMGRHERELLDRRRQRAERNPKDPQALVELGWAVLAVEENPEGAAEVFLRALALADKREDIHHALGICYSLGQRTELAYQFIRSSLRLQGGTVAGAANATTENHKRSILQDEVGVSRGRPRR